MKKHLAGKKRHYELGKWLRKRYTGFLSETYSEEDIYVRSTDVDRSLMSAEANLAGLYPPMGENVWNKTMPWQPIPVHVYPAEMDNVLKMSEDCPKYTRLYQKYLDTTLKTVESEYKEWFDYCTEHSGKTFTSVADFENLHGVLSIEQKDFNFTIPEWTKKVYPNITEILAGISFSTGTSTTALARLKDGPFFYNLISHFKTMTSDNLRDEYFPSHQKLVVFSAHDTTVASILQGLQKFDYLPPPFAATIIFEVFNKKNPYVNIYYKKFDDLAKITLENCEFNCPLGEFEKILEPITVEDAQWYNECNGNTPTGSANFIQQSGVLFIVLIAFNIMCVL